MLNECGMFSPADASAKPPHFADRPTATTTRPPAATLPVASPGGNAEDSFPQRHCWVQSALNHVLRSLATRRIDARQAGLYLHGLQLAAQLAVKSHDKPS